MRALYKPDGKHPYVGRLVRSAALHINNFVKGKLLCRDPPMAGLHLCLQLLEPISSQPTQGQTHALKSTGTAPSLAG